MNGTTKHIILGAGGAVSRVLIDELLSKGEKIKMVSRSGFGMKGTESARANLIDFEETNNAIEESSTVYLTAGLAYNLRVWKESWPKIMQNAITACKAKNARLIFFDNVYLYGKVDGIMTEDSPINPCSKKGEVRADIAGYLMSEMKDGNIKAIIARAADFYGPYSDRTSLPFIFVFDRMANGRKAQWLINDKVKHSYTYTGDCGKTLYLLATTESAYDQVWHLPTASPPLTGEEFIAIAARILGVSPSRSLLSAWKIKLAGIFDKQSREVHEMLYQNKYDYVFGSSKFEKFFDFTPTPYEKGLEETINHFRQRGVI